MSATAAPFQFCPRCAKPLVSTEAGGRPRPGCPDPTCGFIHWGNPVPVVAAIVERDGHVLLGRSKGWAENMFGLITGFLEADETPEAAVLREIKEELGLDASIVSLVGVYAFEVRNELLVVYHVTAAAGPVTLSDELAAYKAVPVEKLRAWPFGTGPAVQHWLDARRATRLSGP